MPLSPGTRLGPYEIAAQIGAGGMGEVYRATDTRLDRTVAVKVLPAHMAAEPEARQRLEREARAVSALNHPNICTLHDVGVENGVHYLVLEYVEGETLADCLKRGPLPLADALRHAIRIAEALDRAHGQGVIHRDLKPGNVMIAKDGVKVLDFGLAKRRTLSPDSATMTQSLTAAGTLVGTWQYMAPELLEGQEADARSDVFAFGALLYEMVTGRAAFEARTQASVIAAIIERQPVPMAVVQAATPPALEHLVQTCLAKDPAQRRQSLHDVLLELRWIAESGSQAGAPLPAAARPRSRERYWMAAAALFAILSGGLTAWVWRLRAPVVEGAAVHFTISPPDGGTLSAGAAAPNQAVSPDGRLLVFKATDTDGKTSLWVRPLDSVSAQRLERTDTATFPFWSPDSKSIAFFADGKLKRMAVSGGSMQTLCEAPRGEGGTWSEAGVIVFAPDRGPLHRVPANGGVSTPVTATAGSEEAHMWPQFLPGGSRFIYFSRRGQQAGIYAQTLGSSERKLVLETTVRAAFVPPGRLLFVREGTLMAQDLDTGNLQLKGEPVPVAEDINANENNGRAPFSVSSNGVLVYRASAGAGDRLTPLVSYTRDGVRSVVPVEGGKYESVALSPDGKRLVVSNRGGGGRIDSTGDLWLLDLASGIFSRLTLGNRRSERPLWSPDSTKVAFTSRAPGKDEIREIVIGTSGETTVFADGRPNHVDAWLPDGSAMLYHVHSGSNGGVNYSLPLSGERKPTALIQSTHLASGMQVSPDGKWVAYATAESGRHGVYLASFPGFTEKRLVSTEEAAHPRWRGDGKELYYLAADGKMMALEVKAGATGLPRVLFQTGMVRISSQYHPYCVTPDGQRFLGIERPPLNDNQTLNIVVNWPAIQAR